MIEAGDNDIDPSAIIEISSSYSRTLSSDPWSLLPSLVDIPAAKSFSAEHCTRYIFYLSLTVDIGDVCKPLITIHLKSVVVLPCNAEHIRRYRRG